MGPIENEVDLKDITDDEINNVWYVKALKQIQEIEEGAKHAAADSE